MPGGLYKLIVHQEYFAIPSNFRHNEQIRISPVFLIDENDTRIGPTPTNEALRRARDAGLDLVEVAPGARPPVCRIMDYGKWRYQQQKKVDKSRAHRGGQLKEVKLRTVRIGDHDLMIKVNRARNFLKEGNKVQFTLQFRGREMTHLELGREMYAKVKQELAGVSKVERDARMEGRRMILILQPDNKTAAGESGGKPAKAEGASRSRSTMSAGSHLNIPSPKSAATEPEPAPTGS